MPIELFSWADEYHIDHKTIYNEARYKNVSGEQLKYTRMTRFKLKFDHSIVRLNEFNLNIKLVFFLLSLTEQNQSPDKRHKIWHLTQPNIIVMRSYEDHVRRSWSKFNLINPFTLNN